MHQLLCSEFVNVCTHKMIMNNNTARHGSGVVQKVGGGGIGTHPNKNYCIDDSLAIVLSGRKTVASSAGQPSSPSSSYSSSSSIDVKASSNKLLRTSQGMVVGAIMQHHDNKGSSIPTSIAVKSNTPTVKNKMEVDGSGSGIGGDTNDLFINTTFARSRLMPFPQRLYQMLHDVEKYGKEDIVSFLPDGNLFTVFKPEEFVNEIIPIYFNMSKFRSFTKQLLNYGFERVANPYREFSQRPNAATSPSSSSLVAYYHPCLIKNDPDRSFSITKKSTAKKPMSAAAKTTTKQLLPTFSSAPSHHSSPATPQQVPIRNILIPNEQPQYNVHSISTAQYPSHVSTTNINNDSNLEIALLKSYGVTASLTTITWLRDEVGVSLSDISDMLESYNHNDHRASTSSMTPPTSIATSLRAHQDDIISLFGTIGGGQK